MNRQRVEWLFKKYADKRISPAERDELMRYVDSAPSEELSSLMEEVFRDQIHRSGEEFFTGVQRDNMLKKILSETGQEASPVELRVDRVDVARKRLLKYVSMAAVLLCILTFAALFYPYHSNLTDPTIVQDDSVLDIPPPSGDRATLTLADGTVISLNEIGEGQIADQGGVIITKAEDGQLVYTLTAFPEALLEDNVIPVYNTVATPSGGQYHVVLPDGTKVWLNAESSLRYPALFSKKERQVELVGEGYFEVAKNENAPFIVKTAEQSVRVLGTHFNINSYQKQRRTETTLLEGSVEVSSSAKLSGRYVSKVLRPGEQAVLGPQADIEVKKVKISNAVAWKNGLFYFDNTAIKDVMEELSRWYNFDFEFEGPVPSTKLWGKVYRNVNAAEALDILSYFNLKYQVVNNPNGGGKWKVVVSQVQ